ncbi:MAG: hypothetical protein WC519_02925, partial [Parcubacteria group bacterium]
MIAIDEREKKVSFPTNLWILWVFISVAAVVVAIGMAFNWSFIPKLPPSTVIVSTATPTPKPTVSTATPTVAPTATLTPEPTVTSVPIETPAPEVFLVSDDIWTSASILYRKSNGDRLPGVGFSEVPKGTEVYAPADGYIFSVGREHEDDAWLVFSENKDWNVLMLDDPNQPLFVFMARDFELLKTEVKKGEAFAKVTDNGEIYPGHYYEREVLLIGLSDAWADALGE